MADAPLVLVVEDDRDVRGLMELVLSTAGFVVVTASDGLEGLLKVRLHRPDALLLDIMMPDVGGLRVLDELAVDAPDLPVIVVTGKPEAAAEARERLGADRVVDKPFDVDLLVARVRAVVDAARTTGSDQ